jgi:hypothetical protein
MRATGVEASLLTGAQRWCERRGRRAARRVAALPRVAAVPDEAVCRELADRFERQPRLAWDPGVARRYRRLQRETRELYEVVLGAGVIVEPWLGPGQPYGESAELVREVRETGTLRVFLTRDGHGPAGSDGFHPMREPAGVSAGGVELTHNDLFRAVHDAFGHVMLGHGFGPAGELSAAYCQLALLSEDARPVAFAEQVAQTCWFFYGPHLRDAAGRLRRPGAPGYVPPRRRPFPPQKVFAAAPDDLAAFERMVVARAAP